MIVSAYAGNNLDGPLPDHSNLSRIRDRYDLAIFQRFVEQVVELLVAGVRIRTEGE
jgi:hypothetical protein